MSFKVDMSQFTQMQATYTIDTIVSMLTFMKTELHGFHTVHMHDCALLHAKPSDALYRCTNIIIVGTRLIFLRIKV